MPNDTWTLTIPDSHIIGSNGVNLVFNPVPACSSHLTNAPQCTINGQTLTVGSQPGQYDKDYNQLVPTCPSGNFYLFGQCRGLGTSLSALGVLATTSWQALPNGTNQAVTSTGQAVLSEFETLLAKERPAMSEFERLLTQPDTKVMSEFERLLAKDVSASALAAEGGMLAESGSILGRAVPILNVALTAYAGWELYEYGKVLFDDNETRNANGGTCPAGWSGSDCAAPDAGNVQTYWPADNKPTYIYHPNNAAQPYVHHPLDPDRTVYDMTQTSAGKWEFVQNDNGSTSEIYLAPTVTYGPVIVERINWPNRGGRTVTVTTINNGNIRGYQPDISAKPADFSRPGPVIIVDPLINNPSSTPGALPTPQQHKDLRKASPKPLTDPGYKPYPGTNPTPSTPTQPDKLTAPTPAPSVSPKPYVTPTPDPATGKILSPFKVPQVTPQPKTETEDATPFGSCGCTLQPPDLNAPTLAETTDTLIKELEQGVGANVSVPDMTGQCPSLGVDFRNAALGVFQAFGDVRTTVHCDLLEQNRAFIESVSLILALLGGVMIVLGP
jgi:hypothetical protein